MLRLSRGIPSMWIEVISNSVYCTFDLLLCQTSYDKVVPPSFVDLGYASMVSIYSELRDQGKSPPVIDSDMLREDPEV